MDATLVKPTPSPVDEVRSVSRTVVLIPAWQPDQSLIELVTRLLRYAFKAIIVVNDGSDRTHDHIFDALSKVVAEAPARVRVVHHAVNLGKGRALKTGLNYFLNNFPNSVGIVTADADGQHTPEDILAVAQQLESDASRLILGARQFQGEIPLRSRVGNSITRNVFAALTGRRLSDTQSGLRGIPIELMPSLLKLSGEGYEYEMNVLTHASQSSGVTEIPIQTIYIDGNRSSHFNPLLDSMRIYFVLLRFVASSLIAAGIDFVVFAFIFWATSNVLASMICGRVSSVVNFAVNRRFVFSSKAGIRAALVKYYALVAAIGAAAYYSIRFLSGTLGMNVMAAKILAETCLWLASFAIQRSFIFNRKARARW